MNDLEIQVNTLLAEYERLYANVLMLRGLYKPLQEKLFETVPEELDMAVASFATLLDRIVEDMDNSYARTECEVAV